MMNTFTKVSLWMLFLLTQVFDMLNVASEEEVQTNFLFIVTLILLCSLTPEKK